MRWVIPLRDRKHAQPSLVINYNSLVLQEEEQPEGDRAEVHPGGHGQEGECQGGQVEQDPSGDQEDTQHRHPLEQQDQVGTDQSTGSQEYGLTCTVLSTNLTMEVETTTDMTEMTGSDGELECMMSGLSISAGHA